MVYFFFSRWMWPSFLVLAVCFELFMGEYHFQKGYFVFWGQLLLSLLLLMYWVFCGILFALRRWIPAKYFLVLFDSLGLVVFVILFRDSLSNGGVYRIGIWVIFGLVTLFLLTYKRGLVIEELDAFKK